MVGHAAMIPFAAISCEVACIYSSRGIHNNVSQTDMTSEPDTDPPCQPARLRTEVCRRCDRWKTEPGQGDRSALCFSWTQQCPQPSLSSHHQRHGLDGSRCKIGARAEPDRAFVSWLITAEYRHPSPPPPRTLPLLLSIFPPSPHCTALSRRSLLEKVLLMTEEGYSIYLLHTPSKACSPCVPAELILPKGEKSNNWGFDPDLTFWLWFRLLKI